jgi:hypothetical protein
VGKVGRGGGKRVGATVNNELQLLTMKHFKEFDHENRLSFYRFDITVKEGHVFPQTKKELP